MWLCNFLKKKKWKWLWAFLVSDVPMFIVMLPYVCNNWSGIQTYRSPRLVAFLLVAIWTYLGPYLIALWFDQFDKFISQIDNIPGSNSAGANSLKSKSLPFWTSVFSIAWTFAIVLILVFPNGRHKLESYFFWGFRDLNYWVFLICVGYVTFQTSIFFYSFLYSKIAIQSIMCNKKIVRVLISNEGKRLSLALIGDVVSKTAIYFCSGFLFFPIMLVFFLETEGEDTASLLNTSALIFVFMGVFIVIIMLYLGHMNRIVTDKAQIEKDCMLNELNEQKKKLATKQHRTIRLSKSILYKMEEQEINEWIWYTAKININPISSNQYMNILSGVVISACLPAIFSFLFSRL